MNKGQIDPTVSYSVALISDGQEQDKLVYPMSDMLLQMRFVGVLCDLTIAQLTRPGAEHLALDVIATAIRAHLEKLHEGKALDFIDEHGVIIRMAMCAPVEEVLH
jgi:hypothetical protein